MPQVRQRHGRTAVKAVTIGASRWAAAENSAEPAMNLDLEDHVGPARRRRRDRRHDAGERTWTIAHIFADHRVGFVTLLTSRCRLSYAELCNRSQRPPPLPHDPQRNLGRHSVPVPGAGRRPGDRFTGTSQRQSTPSWRPLRVACSKARERKRNGAALGQSPRHGTATAPYRRVRTPPRQPPRHKIEGPEPQDPAR